MSSHGFTLDAGKLSVGQAVGLGLWFLTTLVAGTFGWLRHASEHGEHLTVGSAIYHSAQLFLLHAPHFDGHVNGLLEAARWSATTLLAGTILSVGRRVFYDEYSRWRMQRLSGHLVVCGLGRRGVEAVRFERSKPASERRDVVVIDSVPPEDLATVCTGLGARIVTGDATDPAVLDRAGVARASELYAVCAEDSTNCEVALQADLLLEGRTDVPLVCNVHLTDVDLRAALQEHAAAVSTTRRTVRFFDLFDLEARRLLLDEIPADHSGVAVDDPRRVHLIIVGFGRMGRALASRAAKVGHFANATRDPALRLRVSVVDRAAVEREAALLFRYPQFRKCCDLDVHSLDIESIAARHLIEDWCGDPAALCTVAICFDDDPRAVEVALQLLPTVRESGAQVAVRLARRTGLAGVIDLVRRGPTVVSRVCSFGMLDDGCCDAAFADTSNERLARAIHAGFVAEQMPERGAGDPGLKPWGQLGEVFRESNRQQADHIAVKMRAVGCDVVPEHDPRPAVTSFESPVSTGVSEEDLLAAMEHNRWNAERWLAGWTLASGPKNLARRTSPYLVPWAELPEQVQGYDRTAVRLIPALLTSVGLKACRRPRPS